MKNKYKKAISIFASAFLLASCGNQEFKKPSTAAPVLTLNEIGSIAHVAEVSLSGSVKTEKGQSAIVQVTIGEKTQKIQLKDGIFSLNVGLKAGKNEIEVMAIADDGQQQSKKVTVYFGKTVAAGNSHTAALEDGKLYAWGRNNFGQVGLGKVTAAKEDGHPWSPVQIETPIEFVALEFGQHNSAAIGKDGLLYTWGDDQHGQMGRGSSSADVCKNDCRLSIAPAENLSKVVQVSAGHEHLLALDEEGSVWSWGRNTRGQLGHSAEQEQISVPKKVIFSENVRFIAVETSGNSSYAIDENGNVWAWGDGTYGNMGNGKKDQENPIPAKVDLEGRKIKQIVTGRDHVLVLTDLAEVYGWGLNANSQVGHLADRKNPQTSDWPEHVLTPKRLNEASELAPRWLMVNATSSQLQSKDGKIYTWGSYGSMVGGKPHYENLPVPEQRLNNVGLLKEAAAGAMHTIARNKDGNVFVWGWSFEGSLGIGKDALAPWMYNIAEKVTFPK